MSGGVDLSVVIPTYNGAKKIQNCLEALKKQTTKLKFEIIVVDDGSIDGTQELLASHSNLIYVRQENAGPAAARNRGASISGGRIILFTDDDCVPCPNWIDEMVKCFYDPCVIGGKGAYLTKQLGLVAQFVQIEYEDKYDLMKKSRFIDFIDTYSAGFIRDVFLRFGGYDCSFTTACAEDVDLSFRMHASGEKMVFNPEARVFHTHPSDLLSYMKKKYKFAYWRVLAIKKTPSKMIKDSHTPQYMKIGLMCPPLLIICCLSLIGTSKAIIPMLIIVTCFILISRSILVRAFNKSFKLGVASIILIYLRSTAQFFGVSAGLLNFYKKW